MANPFDQFDTAPAPAPQPQGGFTGFIPGAPAPKTPPAQTPTQQALDEERLRQIRLENEEKARKAATGEGDGKAPGVEQSKASGFYSRALKANQAYEQLGVGADAPSTVIAKGILPQALEGYVLPDKRLEADANARGFISAVLRYESGAAIPPEEMDSAYRTYFPQPGEGPDVVAAKTRLRAEAIEALQLGSGAAGKAIAKSFEEQLKAALEDPTKSPQERLAAANAIAQQAQRPINQEDAAAAAQMGRVDVTQEDPSLLQQAGQSLLNVGAGIGEGLVALPDMLAKGAGQIMAAPVDFLGFEDAANQLRNPLQIGEQIEQAVPVPQDWNNWLARQAARVEGGVLGFPQRAANALAEGIVGRVPARPPSGPGPARTPAQDGADLGIDVPAYVAGGPAIRRATSAVSQTIGGAGPIVRGAQRMTGQSENALARIAGQEGAVANTEAAGQAATKGALAFRDVSRQQIGQKYDAAAKMASGLKVKPDRTIAELDRNIAELSQVPGGADGVAYLNTLRKEMVENFPEGVTIEGLRGMRTALRDRFYRDGLRGSDIERRVNGIVDQISDDISTSLIENGKGRAATLFREADAAWAERARVIDDVIMPIIGKKGEKSGEAVSKAIMAASKGNGERLSSFIRSLPPEEAGTVRATLIDSVGRDAAGNFSFSALAKNWETMSESARRALFAEGDIQAMNKLARFADDVKESAKYANHPNTGGVVVNIMTAFLSAADLTAGAATVGGSYALGRALSSPGVARIVARASSAKRPREAVKTLQELTRVAARNPAAANDIIGLQQGLSRALGSPATSAAAEEQK